MSMAKYRNSKKSITKIYIINKYLLTSKITTPIFQLYTIWLHVNAFGHWVGDMQNAQVWIYTSKKRHTGKGKLANPWSWRSGVQPLEAMECY